MSSLRIVLVSRIEEQLDSNADTTASELAVLALLAQGDTLLSTVRTSEVRCALVSYCHEPGSATRDSTFDAFTLDGPALRGIVAAARRLQVEALWCDKWCYRQPGDEYDHDDFTQTLNAVVGGVEAVVWLPRSKKGSSGQYPYRLWCTFETVCVQQRGLPVAIAGEGLSFTQHVVRRLGSFAPALCAQGPSVQMFRLNLAFYLAELALMFAFIASIINVASFLAHTSLTFETFFLNFGQNLVFIVFVNPFVWLGLRAQIGLQVRLARNARRVLRTMTAAATVTERSMRTPGADGRLLARETLRRYAGHTLEALLSNIPWLPCYDKRDVLVIRELIGTNCDAAPTANSFRALAFSAHSAARMSPSAGDDSASRLSLDAWLSQRNLSLDTLTVRASLSSQPADEALPLEELRALGWVAGPGANPALIAPLGVLPVTSPAQDGTWTVVGARLMKRAQLGTASIVFFASRIGSGIVIGSANLAVVLSGAQLDSTVLSGLNLFLGIIDLSFLGIPAAVYVDVETIYQGRVPLPLVVFHRLASNLAAILAIILATFVVTALFVVSVLHHRDDEGAQAEKFGHAIPFAVSYGGLATFLVYEGVIYTNFATHQIRHLSRLEGRSQRVNIRPQVEDELQLIELTYNRDVASSGPEESAFGSEAPDPT